MLLDFFFKAFFFLIRSNVTLKLLHSAINCVLQMKNPQADDSLCFAPFVFFQVSIGTVLPPLTFKYYSNSECISMSQTV